MYPLKLFKSELWKLSLICFKWRHLNCIALRTAAKSFLSDWSTKDRILVMLKTSSKKHIWSNVFELSIWLHNPIRTALGSFVMMSSNDSMMIGYLSCVLLQATPWESQHVTVALTTLSVLTPYAVWISFEIYLFLVLKWNAFHRPNNKESFVLSQGNSSRMCLKHNARQWFLQFMYIACGALFHIHLCKPFTFP